MAVPIRHASLPDAEALVAAYEWLFAPPGSRPEVWDPEMALRRLLDAIDSPDAAVLVAEDGNGLSGFCTAYLEMVSVRFGRRVWVEDLAVHPERRSRGVGKALLDAAKEWARSRGATHLELDSGETRADAHRFYEREGPSWRSVSYGWLL
jgi:GNAT superfamily N-acetyltransferase